MTECRAIVNRCISTRGARSYLLYLALPQTGYRSRGCKERSPAARRRRYDLGQLETRPRASTECLQVQNENICVQVRRCNARAPTANIRRSEIVRAKDNVPVYS